MTTVGVHQLLNTLFVTLQRAYVHVDHETVKVESEGATVLQVPALHLGALVCCGNVAVSSALIHRFAEIGKSVVFLDAQGRFKARLVGPTTGNVLLRQAQYASQQSELATLEIARNVVAGKIQNSRSVMMRGARQARAEEIAAPLRRAAEVHADALRSLGKARDLDQVRGFEGEAADAYFYAFKHLVLVDDEAFDFRGRNRRPPRDRLNALLSFLYTLVQTDYVAAIEGVGLDPQVGFLHSIRPGRPALALDLMEELRSAMADRLALTLINRKQLTAEHFEDKPGGAMLLNDEGRKRVIVAYQKRKSEEVRHEVIERNLPFGLIPHVQVRLLARHLRKDLDHYLPYVSR